MRISILPKTHLGWWSVGLAIPFLILLAFPNLKVLVGQGGVSPSIRIIVPVITVAFITSGIAALITGLISILRSKERAILVFLAVLLGVFCLIFILGEFLFPH